MKDLQYKVKKKNLSYAVDAGDLRNLSYLGFKKIVFLSTGMIRGIASHVLCGLSCLSYQYFSHFLEYVLVHLWHCHCPCMGKSFEHRAFLLNSMVLGTRNIVL